MTPGFQCGSDVTQVLKTSFEKRNFGNGEVRVRSASVVPKRNNGLSDHCYIWVH